MAHSTTYIDSSRTRDPQDTDVREALDAAYDESENPIRLSSIVGIGIVAAMFLVMLFLQTQAAASPI